MFGRFSSRAKRLKQMCGQLDLAHEQDGDGTVHCHFSTRAGPALITLSTERDGMLYVVGGTVASMPPHAIPDGLAEFLLARSQYLSGFAWRGKERGNRVRLSLVGVFAFGDLSVMALASLLQQAASEVGDVADILVGRGVLHA